MTNRINVTTNVTAAHQWLMRRRAAWPHAAGALLLLAAALVWATAQRPLAADNERLRELAAEAAQRPRAAAAPSPAEQLSALEAGLARPDDAVGMVAVIYRLGIDNGLQIPTGEYQLERVPDDRMQRYRLNLPVGGSYPQIRAFILQALETLPVAVDDIQVRRESSGDTLRARLRLSLYLLPA
jgi:Tfp pilus assembly protein PilO